MYTYISRMGEVWLDSRSCEKKTHRFEVTSSPAWISICVTVTEQANANLGYSQLWERMVPLYSRLIYKVAYFPGTSFMGVLPSQMISKARWREIVKGLETMKYKEDMRKVGTGDQSIWQLDLHSEGEPSPNSWRASPLKRQRTFSGTLQDRTRNKKGIKTNNTLVAQERDYRKMNSD